MRIFLLLFLAACGARSGASVQVDLRGWDKFLEPPVTISDSELEDEDLVTPKLNRIRWKLERCRLKGMECQTVVHVFRVNHFGDGHLTLERAVELLTEYGVTDIAALERVGWRGNDCTLVVRVIPK